MAGGVDWSESGNKNAGIAMLAGFVLLSLSAFDPLLGMLEGLVAL